MKTHMEPQKVRNMSTIFDLQDGVHKHTWTFVCHFPMVHPPGAPDRHRANSNAGWFRMENPMNMIKNG
jgi:hypothetical protein